MGFLSGDSWEICLYSLEKKGFPANSIRIYKKGLVKRRKIRYNAYHKYSGKNTIRRVGKAGESMGIFEEVRERYEGLSPVQKRIADYIFKYPDQVCFYSLKELSAMYYLNFSKSQYTLCLKSKSTIMAVEFSEDGYVSGDTIYKVCYHTPSRC